MIDFAEAVYLYVAYGQIQSFSSFNNQYLMAILVHDKQAAMDSCTAFADKAYDEQTKSNIYDWAVEQLDTHLPDWLHGSQNVVDAWMKHFGYQQAPEAQAVELKLRFPDQLKPRRTIGDWTFPGKGRGERHLFFYESGNTGHTIIGKNLFR